MQVFDALKALNTPGLQPPNPRVRPLDNIGKCRPLLPGPAAPPPPAAPVDPAAAAEARRAKEIREAKAAAMKAKAVKIAKREEELRARPPILDVLREKVPRATPQNTLSHRTYTQTYLEIAKREEELRARPPILDTLWERRCLDSKP